MIIKFLWQHQGFRMYTMTLCLIQIASRIWCTCHRSMQLEHTALENVVARSMLYCLHVIFLSIIFMSFIPSFYREGCDQWNNCYECQLWWASLLYQLFWSLWWCQTEMPNKGGTGIAAFLQSHWKLQTCKLLSRTWMFPRLEIGGAEGGACKSTDCYIGVYCEKNTWEKEEKSH